MHPIKAERKPVPCGLKHPRKKQTRPKHQTPSLHALIVDDDPIFRRMASAVAQQNGIAVTDCAFVDEISLLALSDVFDVAIIDYCLDGMQRGLRGTEVAKRLGETPVILVSQSDECLLDSDAWPGSVKAYMSKGEGLRAIFQNALKLKGVNVRGLPRASRSQ